MSSDLHKGVPLPDKKTLELILDKLQKKDIYGVYAEPVDPEELPDYHDVIKQPMDFATVRKKLARGAYSTLKQFESDVFLICTNAMQYNAPDTIYYKQASSIQEQAKLRFQRLRANIDRSEVEVKPEQKKTPSFSLPKKQLRKSVVRTVSGPIGSETISGASAPIGDFQNGSSAHTTVRPNSVEGHVAENSSLADNGLDKGDELLPGKGFVSKLGKRPSVNDENRRTTYNISVQPVTESESIFSTFEGESKQFIPVGLHADHSYARSLARFAATLGSVAWKVAAGTIEQALPEGVKFGRGWVGEYEPLPTPILMPQNYTLKEPGFANKFQVSCDPRNDEKHAAPKKPARDSHKLSVFSNSTRVPVKQESPREASKDMRPPFFGSLRVNPSELTGSNLKCQNSLSEPEKEGLHQVELNHPPSAHVTRPAKPVSQNGNLVSSGSFKHPTTVSLDCNRKVRMDHNLTHQQDRQGLSDPVQMMKMLAEKAHHQHKNTNGSGSLVGPKREDSNIALTAAQAWMSLGGSGGFMQPPLPETASPHQPISADSLYNPSRDRQPPQVSRFGGHFQPDNNYHLQPIRTINEPRFQNQSQHVGFPQLVTADLSRFQVQSGWRGFAPQMQQQSRPNQQESRPPDLNIGYQSMGSPVRQSTGMLVDSQQPDLALQL